MDNITTLELFVTEDVSKIAQNIMNSSTTIDPIYQNRTDPPSLHTNASIQANWTTESQVKIETSLTVLWIYLSVRIVSGVLGILGNSLTLFAVAKFEQLQTCTNYFICNLAVGDLLSGLMVPLVIVHELYKNSEFFITVCLLQQTIAIISSARNGMSILYLSIDRYMYIAFPLRYPNLVTPQRLVIIEGVTWICAILITPILVFGANHLQIGMPCRYHIFLDEWVPTIYMAPQALLGICLTIGFHLAIAKIAHKQAVAIHAQDPMQNSLEVAINKSTKKISLTLAMVLGVYLCSILPQLIMASISFDNPLESYEKYTVALYWANTWVNPLIYTWRLKDFRIAFRKIFTGKGSFNEVPGIPLA